MEPEVEKLMMDAFAKNFIDYEGNLPSHPLPFRLFRTSLTRSKNTP
jgi:hypothetical protein